MNKLMVGLLLGCFAFYAQAKELYVDAATGNDGVSYAANDVNNPWATIGRAVWGSTNRANPVASEAAQAGDTVNVLAGTYTATSGTNERYLPIWNPVNSGSAGSEITIRAQGAVVLRSNTSTSGEPVIGTFNKNYIVWDGFIVDEPNMNTRADTGPVVVWQSSNVTIQGMTIIGKTVSWVDNHNAIRLEYASHTRVFNNTMFGTRNGDNSRNGAAVMLYHCDNITIDNNEIYDASGGIFVKGANDGPVSIHHNLLYDLSSEGVALGGIGTTTASNGADVYQNVIRDSNAGVTFIGYDSVSPANVTVRNNTIHNTFGGGIFFKPNTNGYSNLVFRNNIIADGVRAIQGEDISDLSSTTFEYNFYNGNGTHARVSYNNYSFGAWQSTFNKDVTGSVIGVDPQFTDVAANDFTLQGGLSLTSSNSGGPVGAYITGTEVIGTFSGNIRPNPPTNVTAQ